MEHEFYLCSECYQISDSDAWIGFNWNDEHTELIPAIDDPTFVRCPCCKFDHSDNENSAVYAGWYEDMIKQVKELIEE